MTATKQVTFGPVAVGLFGFAFSQVTTTAVRLGVLEVLEDGPKPVTAIAAETSSHPPFLRRLLRALVSFGLAERRDGEEIALTPSGAQFLENGTGALHALSLLYGDPASWQAWGSLEETVRTGRTSFAVAHGESLFQHLDHNSRLADRFHRAMRAATRTTLPGIVQGHDFGRFRSLVDVGGGDGTLIAALLEAHQHARGLVYDTERGLADAEEVFASAGVSDRAETMVGDFFQAVPSGGDGYLLKNILHDWDDHACRSILRNCRAAMGERAELLIFTLLVPEREESNGDPDDVAAALSDIEMMVLTSGRERTLGEYRDLLAETGFRLVDSTVLAGHPNHHLVRAVPA